MGRKLSILAAMMLLSTWPAVADPAGEVQACQTVRKEVEQCLVTGGACPCPYNAAHDGHFCGGRSAWAKRKGASPLCFTGDPAQPRCDRVEVARSASLRRRDPDASYSVSNLRDADRRDSQFRVK